MLKTIDLHSHILPDFDDGSQSVEMSLAMLRREQNRAWMWSAPLPIIMRTMKGSTHSAPGGRRLWSACPLP